ncbi:MAG: ATP synthase F1 subunit gamma [Calditrichaeota bacterium]|nr:MAG: ATP synthase F1 subunit gamma [Calditrichota bacterium]
MATLRAIKQRIKSIKSTQQITRAMKMVAAAKMRRAQDQMLAARPYAHQIKSLMQRLLAGVDSPSNPLLIQRPVLRMTLVVITADRGLCGAFNHNLIKRAEQEFHLEKDKEISLVCIGKKGYDHFRKRNYNLKYHYTNVFNNLTYEVAEEIAERLMEEVISNKTDAVRVIFNEFKTVLQQNLVVEDFLPIPVDDTVKEQGGIDYLYEPSREELLDVLVPRHLKMQIWRALLESFAAEQAARMTAMENATDNASELISNLTLEYNKARQASITKEILDIMGGAEALRQASS